MKKCSRCKEYKTVDLFPKHKHTKDKLGGEFERIKL